MIPKIVHYCWLSGDPIPDNLKEYMSSWKEKLPDWEFMLWDKTRFDLNNIQWVRQAYEAKKYAFAADYIRQYAVYTFGGFYMDMDIEVIKNFDYLLSRKYVLGAETEYGIEAGIFGAEKGSNIIKTCLEWYSGKSFIKEDGSLNMHGCPLVMMEAISKKYNVCVTSNYTDRDDTVYLLPRDFLTAKSSETGVITKTANTVTVHHFSGSWLKTSAWGRIKRSVKQFVGKMFGERAVRYINKITH